jgi:iron(III) transport system permease protein
MGAQALDRSQSDSPSGQSIRWDADRVLLAVSLAVPLAVICLFFVYPLLVVAQKSLTEADGSIGIANYVRILDNAAFWRATRNSVLMGLATMAVSMLLGTTIAYGVYRCRFPGRGLIQLLVSLPLLAPSLVQGLGLIFLLGRNGLVSKTLGVEINIYGFWGLLIANSLYALPQVVLIIGASLRNADARIYEAATVMGSSGWQQFFSITLPSIKFSLLSAAFVVFTVTITDFGNAAVIGGNYSVLATEIYNQVAGQMNFNTGAVVGILLLLPTVLAFYLERVASNRQATAVSASATPFQPEPNTVRDIPMGIASALIAALPALTVLIVVVVSFTQLWPYRFNFTLRHYSVSVAGGYDPLWTTIQISLFAGGLGVLCQFAMGLALQQVSRRTAKLVYFICLLPAAVPGMVLGLSYIFAFNLPGTPLYYLYGSALLLAMCNVMHYWTQAFVATSAGMRQFPAALDETATCLGAGFARRVLDVIGPFALPTLIAVFFYLFMRSMVTLSGIVFLITPTLSVASVSIMRLDEAGSTSQAAAYASCTMAVVILASLLMRLSLRMFKPRTEA